MCLADSEQRCPALHKVKDRRDGGGDLVRALCPELDTNFDDVATLQVACADRPPLLLELVEVASQFPFGFYGSRTAALQLVLDRKSQVGIPDAQGPEGALHHGATYHFLRRRP